MSKPFPLFPHAPIPALSPKVLRGTTTEPLERLQAKLKETYPNGFEEKSLLKIGELEIPTDLESYGFFYIGAPGTGKSQTIFSNIKAILKRRNFRTIILDTDGEILAKFYNPNKFILFAPWDKRSITWSHVSENVSPEMIADSLIPEEDHGDEPFWAIAAKELLTGVYEVTQTNGEVYELINKSLIDLSQKIPYMSWLKKTEKTASSVIAVLKTYIPFYKTIPEPEGNNPGFSFFAWGASNDPRSLLIPIFPDQISRYRPLLTMAIRQALKGLLTNAEGRKVKTAVVIDEMGSLYKIEEIFSILAQGRKYKTTIIGATQTLAQLEKIYGEPGVEILLQTIKTKLVLGCPDYQSALKFSELMGIQEQIILTKSSDCEGKISESEVIQDRFTVHPTEIQSLPPLKGYIHVSGGFPISLTTIVPANYPSKAQRQIPNHLKPRKIAPCQDEYDEDNEDGNINNNTEQKIPTTSPVITPLKPEAPPQLPQYKNIYNYMNNHRHNQLDLIRNLLDNRQNQGAINLAKKITINHLIQTNIETIIFLKKTMELTEKLAPSELETTNSEAILDKICQLIEEENKSFPESFCKIELIRIALIRQEKLWKELLGFE